MYSRKDVCALTGMPENQFKVLARNDQLPVTRLIPLPKTADEILDHARERGWNFFSPFDVLLIGITQRLMSQIGYSTGVSGECASKIVANGGGAVSEMFDAWLKSGKVRATYPDVWFGYVGAPIDAGAQVGGWNVAGTLPVIAKEVAARPAEPHPMRLVVVNTSAVLREIIVRAERTGIEWPKIEAEAKAA